MHVLYKVRFFFILPTKIGEILVTESNPINSEGRFRSQLQPSDSKNLLRTALFCEAFGRNFREAALVKEAVLSPSKGIFSFILAHFPQKNEKDVLRRTNSQRRLPDPGIMARGYAWPSFCKDWEARLDALAGFEPRDDDVFVISYPKSGHHWSHEFLSMIINEKTDMPQMTTGDGFLEYDTLEKLDENPSPRLILTALQFQFLPKRILEKGNKIIRITRNPKDVCVSYYNHTR